MIFVRDTLRSIAINGTTAAARPELAGVVVEDRLRQFATSPGSAPSVTGTLQERIVQNSDDTFAFYYRVTALAGGNIRTIQIQGWPLTDPLDGDYRIDGLGVVGPLEVGCSPADVFFSFRSGSAESLVTPTELSRFMFIKMVPSAPTDRFTVTGYDDLGTLALGDLRTWSASLAGGYRPTLVSR